MLDVGINFIDPCASASASAAVSASAVATESPPVINVSTTESVTSNAPITPASNIATAAKRRLVGDVDFAGASQRASWITRTRAFFVIVNLHPTQRPSSLFGHFSLHVDFSRMFMTSSCAGRRRPDDCRHADAQYAAQLSAARAPGEEEKRGKSK